MARFSSLAVLILGMCGLVTALPAPSDPLEPAPHIGVPINSGSPPTTHIGTPQVNTTEAQIGTPSLNLTAGHPVSMLSLAPAMPHGFADPALVTDAAGVYWAFATDDVATTTADVMVHGGNNVQVANSSDFASWAYVATDALPFAGAWAANPPHVWAPDVVRLANDSYVLYYAATPAADPASHCIGAATAAHPAGPYRPLPTPLHCPTAEGGAIDPAGFHDPATDKRYVLFKVDGNNGQPGGACGNVNPTPRATPIRMQEVAPDGVSPVGAVVQILDRDDSDGPLVEAPSMVAVPYNASAGGYLYVLFYSSHCYTTANYNVRYAVSTNGVLNGMDNSVNATADNAAHAADAAGIRNANNTLHADYAKHATPLLSTTEGGLVGPGGLDVHPDGKHVVFHAAQVADQPGTRRMHWGLIQVNGTTVTV